MMMITTSEGKKSTLKINKAKFLRRRQGRTSMRKVSSISAGHKLIGAKRNSKASSPFLSAYDAKRQSRWIKPRVFSRARWTPGTPVLRCMRPIRSGTAAITRFLFRIPFYPATFYQLNEMGGKLANWKTGRQRGKTGFKKASFHSDMVYERKPRRRPRRREKAINASIHKGPSRIFYFRKQTRECGAERRGANFRNDKRKVVRKILFFSCILFSTFICFVFTVHAAEINAYSEMISVSVLQNYGLEKIVLRK